MPNISKQPTHFSLALEKSLGILEEIFRFQVLGFNVDWTQNNDPEIRDTTPFPCHII